MARYQDNTDRLFQLIDILEKRINIQQEEIRDLQEYKKKNDEHFSIYREEKEMLLFKIFKHSEQIIPTGEVVDFKPVELSCGHYFLDVSMTYVNMDLCNDAGVSLGLFLHDKEFGTETLLSTGSAAWFGRMNGSDEYSSRQTVFIRATLTITNENKKGEYNFVLKKIGSKHSYPVIHNSDFPCLFTIF